MSDTYTPYDLLTGISTEIDKKIETPKGSKTLKQMWDALKTVSNFGDDIVVQYGYYTEDGKFQQLDLSGDTPVEVGDPIDVDIVSFNTGR